MTRGSVIIPRVILVAGAGDALAMSSPFWAGTALFGTSPAFTIAGALKARASLRFAMRGHSRAEFCA